MRPAHQQKGLGKCKIMRPGTGDPGRQAGEKCKSCGQSTQNRLETVGGKWETSVKSCGQSTHSELETVGVKSETSVKRSRGQSAQRRLETVAQVGDKWETSVKSCGQSTQSTHKRMETNGRQVQNHAATATTVRQERKPGDKCKVMQPRHAPLSKE